MAAIGASARPSSSAPRGRRRSRRVLAAAVAAAGLGALWLGTLGVPGPAQAAGSDPAVTATVGLGGAAAPTGSWVPLQVVLKGGSSDLSGGELVVGTGPQTSSSQTINGGGCVTANFPGGQSVACGASGAVVGGGPGGGSGAVLIPAKPPGAAGGASLPGMTYRLPVDVPAAVEKHLSLAIQLTGAPVHVELRRGGGTVSSVEVTPAAGSGHPIVGVLADAHAGLDAVPGLTLPASSSVIDAVSLTAADLPDSAALLRPLSAILVDGAATGSLTDAQRSAIAAWVGDGGGLVVTTGTLARQTLTGLPQALLPATATGEALTAALPAVVGALSGSSPPAQSAALARLIPVAGATVTVRGADGTPLVVERPSGQGIVVVTAFDPGAEPIASWQGQRRLLGDLMARSAPQGGATTIVGKGGRIFPTGGFGGTSTLSDVALAARIAPVFAQTPGISLPSSAAVGAMLAAYILCAGPLSYLVLTRLRRRDLLWITVPALAIVAGLGAYWSGLGSRGSAVVASEVRVVHLDGGITQARVDTYTALWTPRGGDADVAIAGTPAVGGLAALSRDDGATMALLLSQPNTMQLRGAPSASIHGFSSSSAAAPSGGLTATLRRGGGTLSGTVTNHLGVTLHNVAISSWAQQSQQLGDLADGASVQVTVAEAPTGMTGGGGCCFNGAPCGPGFGCGPSPAPTSGDVEQRRRAALASVLSPGFDGSAPVLTGIADHPIVAPDLTGDVSVTTIDSIELPLRPTAPATSARSEASGRLLGTSSITFAGTYGASLQSGDNAVYDYRLPQGTTTATVTVSAAAGCVPGGSCTVVPIPLPGPAPTLPPLGSASLDRLDPSTGAWTPVTLQASDSDLSAALPPAALHEGVVVLRLTAQGGSIAAQPPTLGVTGSGGAQ